MSAPTEETAKQLRSDLESACATERQLIIRLRNGDMLRGRISAILNGVVWVERGPRIGLTDIESVRALR